MEIHQLELLDVLVKQGSFKKAAEATFVSTSTLTRQVSSMEAECSTVKRARLSMPMKPLS